MSSSSPPLPIRCIAFDAVGTLIHPEPTAARVYYDVGRRYGSKQSETQIAARFHEAFRLTERNDLDAVDAKTTGALATSEEIEFARWRQIVERTLDDVDDPDACFRELYAHFARPESWKCFDDAARVLPRLHAAGYRLLLASNFDGRLESVRAGLPELRPIAASVISAAVGFRKPSLRFFEALFQAGGCLPSQTLMVGDDFENDVLGARAAGAFALLIDRRGRRSGVDVLGTLESLFGRLETGGLGPAP